MQIRDAIPADSPSILALNEESVHFLSPLDAPRLAALHAQAAYSRVMLVDRQIVGTLLALREHVTYDSVNYRWFADRYPAFLYIDRVIVLAAKQGLGIGRRLYEDLFEFARRSGAPRITCEFDVQPPNPGSQRFHAAFGFREVGVQRSGAANKTVSLQTVEL